MHFSLHQNPSYIARNVLDIQSQELNATGQNISTVFVGTDDCNTFEKLRNEPLFQSFTLVAGPCVGNGGFTQRNFNRMHTCENVVDLHATIQMFLDADAFLGSMQSNIPRMVATLRGFRKSTYSYALYNWRPFL